MNHGLPTAIVAKIHEVLSRHPEVKEAILYGSRAKGNFKPGSDIDLTRTGARLDERTRRQIDGGFDDLLMSYECDTSLLATITHSDLRDHIRRVGVTFYEQQPMRLPEDP